MSLHMLAHTAQTLPSLQNRHTDVKRVVRHQQTLHPRRSVRLCVQAGADTQAEAAASTDEDPQLAAPQTVSSFLRGLLAPAIRPADPLLQAAEGIRQSIASGNEAVIPGLVDTLLSAPRPFDERQLGGGPWQVVWSRGPLLWQGWGAPGRLANLRNEASQDFDPSSRTVVNSADVFGKRVFVTADGTYQPQGDTSSTPSEVQTSVTGATLHAFGKQLALPIRGKGKFTIMYTDDSLRLLRGGGNSLVVQVRADMLQKLVGKRRSALEGQ